MPRMIAEGIILKDDGAIESIKNEAIELLANGPEKWSEETIITKRYFITDALDDFIGSTTRSERIFIANTLAELVSEFVLRTNRQWIGHSKWIVSSLKHFDEDFADYFVEVFDVFYRTNDKTKIVKLDEKVLEPYGGKLFYGFSLGKDLHKQN